MNKIPHEDHKYIEALVAGNDLLLREIYSRFSGKISSYILSNGGNAEDAQDVIQETLITLYHQAKEKQLVLTCPFEAYFFLLCKRKWINKLKSEKQNRQVTILEESVSITDEQAELAEETELFEKRTALFEAKFKELGQKCKELLEKTFLLKSMEKVAEALSVTYGYARKKKSQCMAQLIQMIKGSEEYYQL